MPHVPALELSGLLIALLTLHHTLQKPHDPCHSRMGRDTFTALFIYLFTSVKKKCPNLACWRLAACDQAQGDHVCVWSQRAKLKSPINALICGAAKVSLRKGLSLFSPCHLCAPGCDLSWMSVSLAGGSSYSYGGWKRVVLCNPWCNSTNWSR